MFVHSLHLPVLSTRPVGLCLEGREGGREGGVRLVRSPAAMTLARIYKPV